MDQIANARKIGSVSFKLSFAFVALESIKEGGCSGSLSLLESCHFKFFEFNISSKDVGANKPSENHFHSARELLGLGKDEILHIGDHKINDMLGAINYGCEALWFNPDKKVWDLKDTKKPFEFSIWKGLTEKISSFYS